MLKGEAKTAYMREYMRRKRAGQPTTTTPPKPKPKAEWEPSQCIINEIDHWRRMRAHRLTSLRGLGARVIEGLTLDSDESWMEACRRYKAFTDERRANRGKEKQAAAEAAAEAAAKPKVRHCWFCREPTSTKRIFVGDGALVICEICIAEAATIVAVQRGTASPDPVTMDVARAAHVKLSEQATARIAELETWQEQAKAYIAVLEKGDAAAADVIAGLEQALEAVGAHLKAAEAGITELEQRWQAISPPLA